MAEQQTVPKPTNAVLNITNACNLSCIYCFCKQNNQSMSYETAVAACEYVLENSTDTKPSIWFFGGEPLMEYNSIIKPLIENYRDAITWGITTNGVLLNEDKVDFFSKHKVTPLLSIDGAQEVQDKLRPMANGAPSFDKVLRNIPYLLLLYPNITFRSTLTKYSIPHMNETYDFAAHMGFRNIAFVINEEEEYHKWHYQTLIEQYDKIVIKILRGSPLWLSDLKKAQDYTKSQTCSNINRCGYGTTSIGVTVNGDITPCQELNTTNNFIIGNVHTGIDAEKHKSFLNIATQKTELPSDLTYSQREFLLNALCPKHQYLNNNFSVTTGRLYQMLALQKAYNHFHLLTTKSANPYYRRISL